MIATIVKINHNVCFAAAHFLCQFAVLRLTCDQGISAYVDLGYMKLASSLFGIISTCHIAINISPHSFQEKTQNEFQKGGWHRGPRYAFDMFAREFHMSVQKF